MVKYPSPPFSGWPSFFSALALCLLFAGVQARALSWQTTRVQLKADTATEEVLASYPFVNDGASPTRILRVTTGCDCATSEADTRSYAPGESGTLTLRFRIGARTGLQKRSIEVVTGGETETHHRLELEVDIVELLQVRPRLVFWRKDSAAEPREISLLLAQPADTQLEGVECNSAKFECELLPARESEGAFSARLRVRPLSTASLDQCEITVRYLHKGLKLTARVYAAVR